jgi:hypothetical protein
MILRHSTLQERVDNYPDSLRVPFLKGYSDYRNGFKSDPPADIPLKEAYFAGWNWAIEMSRR